MRLLTQILFFSCMSLTSLPSIAKFSTPAKIMQQLQERGVNSVVAEINEKYEQDNMLHSISTGDTQWLQIAFKLNPNAHPKFPQKIINALSVALTENPVEVLALAKAHRTLSFTDICTIPNTLNKLDKKKEFAKKMMNSLNAAEKSNTGENRDNIEICMWEFEKARNAYF
ncbi:MULTISPECIES: hypothetical protein [Xenorhabdus]|uniref:Secreted protein n=2 Tax=Xenorhabdus TaxID=626 RepID=A0ABT5LPR8_9GAMM|nr:MULTISPECIES: hypothetical protein [Xenorhabdus]MDC9589209.1 hypothetical protein [Xenorhabdus yunnanensis]MDC9595803.1 hypothetical protein [Xenorhabdus anantnagensis]